MVKQAFEKARNLAKDDKLVREIEVALNKGDFYKLKEVLKKESDLLDENLLIYSPTKKHLKSRWGTVMDLDDSIAKTVLNELELLGKQRYGYHNGKIYEFQPDNVGGWHGYPIPSKELVSQKGGSVILRKWLTENKISETEYNKFLK